MSQQALAALWRDHEGAIMLAALGLVFAAAWVRIFLGQRTVSGLRAPERWYTTYRPAPFLTPERYSLRELEREFGSQHLPEAAAEGTGFEAGGERTPTN